MTDLELREYLEKAVRQNEQWRKDHLDDMDRSPTATAAYNAWRIKAAICLGRIQAYQDVLETMRKALA